jgi:hypothetical protein
MNLLLINTQGLQIADKTKHNAQEIQEISPHVFDRSYDQPTQLGYLSHIDLHYRSGSETTSSED